MDLEEQSTVITLFVTCQKNFQESLERDFLLQIKKIVVSSIVLILKIQLATRRVANYRGLI